MGSSQIDQPWRDRALNKGIKVKLMKTLVWPLVMHGCEAWTIKADDIRKSKSFEERYREVLRISWAASRTKESVLEEMGVQRMLTEIIKKIKAQYFGHITCEPTSSRA